MDKSRKAQKTPPAYVECEVKQDPETGLVTYDVALLGVGSFPDDLPAEVIDRVTSDFAQEIGRMFGAMINGLENATRTETGWRIDVRASKQVTRPVDARARFGGKGTH